MDDMRFDGYDSGDQFTEAWLILEAQQLHDRLELLKRFEDDRIRRQRLERIRFRADMRILRRQGGPFDSEPDYAPTPEAPF